MTGNHQPETGTEPQNTDSYYRDPRFWMVVIALTLLLLHSVQHYPGF